MERMNGKFTLGTGAIQKGRLLVSSIKGMYISMHYGNSPALVTICAGGNPRLFQVQKAQNTENVCITLMCFQPILCFNGIFQCEMLQKVFMCLCRHNLYFLSPDFWADCYLSGTNSDIHVSLVDYNS